MDIYYNYSQSLFKTDLHFSLKLFKDMVVKVLVRAIFRVYLKLLRGNKKNVAIYKNIIVKLNRF